MLTLNHGIKASQVRAQQEALFGKKSDQRRDSDVRSDQHQPRDSHVNPDQPRILAVNAIYAPSSRASLASPRPSSEYTASNYTLSTSSSQSTLRDYSTSTTEAMASPGQYTSSLPQQQQEQPQSPVQRRTSDARKFVKNFSRRFGGGSSKEQKPLDINSLPQTVPAAQGSDGPSISHDAASTPPQASAGAQQDLPQINTHPASPTNTSDYDASGRNSADSTLSSPRPMLRPPQPHRIHSQIFAARTDFKLPELPWLCGTWYITHSTLPMWRDKRNVRITYTRLAGDKLDDLCTFQQLPGTESGEGVGTAAGMTGPEAAYAAGGSPPSSPTHGSGKRKSFNIKSWNEAKAYATGDMRSDLKDLSLEARDAAVSKTASLRQDAKDFNPHDIGVNGVGSGSGDGDRYKGAAGELKQVRGTDTVGKDGSYVWRGKGFGLLKTGTWEVLGWGGGGKSAAAANSFAGAQPGDTTADQWIITYFGRTMFSAPGISICARRKSGLSEKMLRRLMEGLRRIDGELVQEGRGSSEAGVGDFGKMIAGLYEVSRDGMEM